MGLFRHWLDGISVPMLLGLRFLIGGSLLAVAALALRHPLPRGKTLLLLLAMGCVGYVGEASCYFFALEYAPVGLVSLLLYTYPGIVTIFARLFLREHLSPARWVALVLAAGGSVLAIWPALSGAAGVKPIGVVLGLGTAVIYAAYILAGAKIPRTVHPLTQASVIALSGGAVLFGVALARGDAFPATPRAWAGTAGLAVLCTTFAVTAFLAGLAIVGPVRASILSVIEPVATIAVGAIALGERLAPIQFAGGGLILGAAILTAVAGKAAPRPLNEELPGPSPHA